MEVGCRRARVMPKVCIRLASTYGWQPELLRHRLHHSLRRLIANSYPHQIFRESLL